MPIEAKIYFTLLIISAIMMCIGFGISFINEKIGIILTAPFLILFAIGVFAGLLILIWGGIEKC